MAERSAKQLGLSKADLPNSIIEVIATLTKNGFEAFIVGGGVRDTLLGLNPKDFDAVTDAKPHEIKDLFGKRCRIIGRRFQLAHVYSGRDMIEVATFRGPPTGSENTTSDGMIVRDNVWGNIDQDFVRRDFSINALYYEPLKGVVHDFCNAFEDIKSKTLRLLGHAPTRIEEDPVRLLRALRFKAKLEFEFDDALASQFNDKNWALLDQVSPHRLYDESQKMFTGGYLVPLLPLLFEYGAIKHLIIYPPKRPSALVSQVAINTDKRIAIGKSINPAFFYAALLWDNYLYQLAKFKKKNMPFHDAQLQAASRVIDRQRIKTAIPKFAEQFIRDIWVMQPKLANPRVKQVTQLAEHSRFRAAFDFLLLREHCNDAANPLSESTNGMGEWWQTYQTLSEKQKQKAIDDFANDVRRGSNKTGRSRGSRSRNRNKETPHLSSDTGMIDKGQQTSEEQTFANEEQTSSPSKTKQHNRYSQERAQLQKLSLGNVAGEHTGSTSPPNPLFTISADKLAKQVPSQLKIDTNSSINDTKLQASKDMKAVNKAAHSYKNDVPNRRRRRLPSQTLTQLEKSRLANDSGAANHKASSYKDNDATSQSTRSKPNKNAQEKANTALTGYPVADSVTSDSTAYNDKHEDAQHNSQSKSNTAQHESTGFDPVAKAATAKATVFKNERIPHKRQRRRPSSTQTVIERMSL